MKNPFEVGPSNNVELTHEEKQEQQVGLQNQMRETLAAIADENDRQDPHNVAEFIERLVSANAVDPVLYMEGERTVSLEDLAAKARQLADRNFSPNKTVKEILEALDGVTQEPETE